MHLYFLDRWIAWLYTRRLYGRRCVTRDIEDFEPELFPHHCPSYTCTRCGGCLAWDEYDEVYRS